MTSTTSNPDEAFLRRLTGTLEGVRIAEAISGLVSALLLVVISGTQDEQVQTGMVEAIAETMRTKLKEARVVAETGQLPN